MNAPLLSKLALVISAAYFLLLRGVWRSRGYELVGFCLTGAAAMLGAESVASSGAGRFFPGSGFSSFAYGAWIALGLVVVLILLATARFVALTPSSP